MVTQFHTLLHFVTLFTTISSLSASEAASTSMVGVSKSHLLSIYACKRMYMHTCTNHCSGAYVWESVYYGVQCNISVGSSAIQIGLGSAPLHTRP